MPTRQLILGAEDSLFDSGEYFGIKLLIFSFHTLTVSFFLLFNDSKTAFPIIIVGECTFTVNTSWHLLSTAFILREGWMHR